MGDTNSESNATAASSTTGGNDDAPLTKAKLFTMGEDNTWTEIGVGAASVVFPVASGQSDSDTPTDVPSDAPVPRLIIESLEDDKEVLLSTPLCADDIYNVQKGTILVWTDPELGRDMAASFHCARGCKLVTDQIRAYQEEQMARNGATPSSAMDGDTGATGHKAYASPWAVRRENLAALRLAADNNKQNFAIHIVKTDGAFMRDLIAVYRQCHAAGDTEGLQKIGALVLALLSPPYTQQVAILSALTDEQVIDGTIDMVQYGLGRCDVESGFLAQEERKSRFQNPAMLPELVVNRVHYMASLQTLRDLLPLALDESDASNTSLLAHFTSTLRLEVLRSLCLKRSAEEGQSFFFTLMKSVFAEEDASAATGAKEGTARETEGLEGGPAEMPPTAAASSNSVPSAGSSSAEDAERPEASAVHGPRTTDDADVVKDAGAETRSPPKVASGNTTPPPTTAAERAAPRLSAKQFRRVVDVVPMLYDITFAIKNSPFPLDLKQELLGDAATNGLLHFVHEVFSRLIIVEPMPLPNSEVPLEQRRMPPGVHPLFQEIDFPPTVAPRARLALQGTYDTAEWRHKAVQALGRLADVASHCTGLAPVARQLVVEDAMGLLTTQLRESGGVPLGPNARVPLLSLLFAAVRCCEDDVAQESLYDAMFFMAFRIGTLPMDMRQAADVWIQRTLYFWVTGGFAPSTGPGEVRGFRERYVWSPLSFLADTIVSLPSSDRRMQAATRILAYVLTAARQYLTWRVVQRGDDYFGKHIAVVLQAFDLLPDLSRKAADPLALAKHRVGCLQALNALVESQRPAITHILANTPEVGELLASMVQYRGMRRNLLAGTAAAFLRTVLAKAKDMKSVDEGMLDLEAVTRFEYAICTELLRGVLGKFFEKESDTIRRCDPHLYEGIRAIVMPSNEPLFSDTESEVVGATGSRLGGRSAPTIGRSESPDDGLPVNPYLSRRSTSQPPQTATTTSSLDDEFQALLSEFDAADEQPLPPEYDAVRGEGCTNSGATIGGQRLDGADESVGVQEDSSTPRPTSPNRDLERADTMQLALSTEGSSESSPRRGSSSTTQPSTNDDEPPFFAGTKRQKSEGKGSRQSDTTPTRRNGAGAALPSDKDAKEDESLPEEMGHSLKRSRSEGGPMSTIDATSG